MIIDAHQHVWQIAKNDCAWPTSELAAIFRDFDVAELEGLARPLGVAGSVLVQSQPSARDTDWLLGIARKNGFIRGVVGWADLLARDAPARISTLSQAPKLRGLRPMLQALANDWLLNPALRPAIQAMIASRLSLDALVTLRHLPALLEFAIEYPRLSIVIDHGAKPTIASGSWEPWAIAMAKFAALPNVFCKLSGLLTEAGADQSARTIGRYGAHLLDVFGASRLMWGSDWPVLNLVSNYTAWFRMARDMVDELEGEAVAAIFGGTAQAFYRL